MNPIRGLDQDEAVGVQSRDGPQACGVLRIDRDDSADDSAGGWLHPRLLGVSEWCGCRAGVVDIGDSFAGKPERDSIPVRVSQFAALILGETSDPQYPAWRRFRDLSQTVRKAAGPRFTKRLSF